MKIFLLSGELSGDLYGSLVIKAIRELKPEVRIMAVGGKELKSAGADILRDNQTISVVGFYEGIKSSPRLWRIKKKLKKEIISFGPDIFLPISFGGFALPLIRELKREGIKIVYLSPPQIWAWGRRRVSFLKRYVDKIICLFPFEFFFYQKYSLPVFYFGNPLTDLTQSFFEDAQRRKRDSPIISLAPGSRREEIKRHLPFLKEVFFRVNKDREYLGFIIRPPNLLPKELGETGEMIFATEKRYEIIARSELVIGKLGTISLESILLGRPYVGIYLPSLPSYILGRFLVRTKLFSLPNLILKEKVFPEFISPTQKAIEEAVRVVLRNKEFYERYCLKVREILTEEKPASRIAEAILS